MSQQELSDWADMEGRTVRTLGACTPTSRVVVRRGVAAALISPRCPFNLVGYADREAVVAELPALADMYREAGARWKLLVHPGDDRVGEAAAAAGLRVCETLEAMTARLADKNLAPRREVAVESGSWAEVIAVNAAAGLGTVEELSFLAGIGEAMACWVVRRAGRAVACCAVFDRSDGVAQLLLVASLPEVRGQGCVTGLLRQVMTQAKVRGTVTSVLSATELGRPVYARLGYRALGAAQMWAWEPA